MTRSLAELTSPMVAELIERNPLAVIPLGSVEQHGDHLPCGTDMFAAELVADAVARELDGLLVPFAPYGVTPIHAGHPGTIDLGRTAFEALLSAVCHQLVDMGVQNLVLVNWHEGNIASMDSVATDIQGRHDVFVVSANACYVAQRLYAEAGGELTHGGGIEALAVLAHDPSLVEIDGTSPPTLPPEAVALDEMRRGREVYGYVTDVTEIDESGWYGDPQWATTQNPDDFAGLVASDIVATARHILGLRKRQ